MQKTELAIATVPIQKWGPVYDGEKALEIGTIFEELNMPFFAAEELKASRPSVPRSVKEQESCDLMKKLMETDFVIQDLTLYLDTHEEDKEALKLFQEKSREQAELKERFSKEFYPLTRDCMANCPGGDHFCWQSGPIPWEGVCV